MSGRDTEYAMDDGAMSAALWDNDFFLPALITSAWLGALIWEILYNLPFDVSLLFAQGWGTPSRLLTRLSYFICRYFALAAQIILLGFWTNPYLSGAGCMVGGELYDFMLMFSYLACNTVLLSRALTFFPRKRGWELAARAMLVLSYLNAGAWIVALPGVYRLAYHQYGNSCRPILSIIRPYQMGLNVSMLVNVLVVLSVPWARMSVHLRTAVPLLLVLRAPPTPGAERMARHLVVRGINTFLLILLVTVVKVLVQHTRPDNCPLKSALVLSGAAIFSGLCSVTFRETYRSACALRELKPHTTLGVGGGGGFAGEEGMKVCFQAFDDGPKGEKEECETLANITVVGYAEAPRPSSSGGECFQMGSPSLPPPPRRTRRRIETIP